MAIGRLPEELLARLENQFGKFTVKEMLSVFSASRLPTFRVNTLRAAEHEVLDRFNEAGVKLERVMGFIGTFKVKNLNDRKLLGQPLCLEGKIYVQGLMSMAPPLVLDPKPGETVLDMCAAPGSKTSQIAALMKNSGKLVASENDEIRHQKLLKTLSLQGVTNAEVLFQDGAMLGGERPETFDRVLVDAPCSAEGRIDFNDPRSYRFWSSKNIVAHAKMQRRLFKAAVACLKPGGTLVYSTCTLAPEENELMVTWLLKNFPELKVVAVALPLKSVRVSKFGTTILPTREHEGGFVAKLIKNKI